MDSRAQPRRTLNSKVRNTVVKHLPDMMYGFGDVKTPREDSVNLMEKLVSEYIEGVTTMAMNKAVATGATRAGLQHFMYVLKNSDKKKEERVLQLLAIFEEIKREKRSKTTASAKRKTTGTKRKTAKAGASRRATKKPRQRKRSIAAV